MLINLTIDERIVNLCLGFEDYISVLEENSPFKNKQWSRHKETVELRKTFATVEEAIESDDFLNSLWKTLASWGMNRGRGGGLISPADFKYQLRTDVNKSRLISLENINISQLNSEVLLRTFRSLELSASQKQVVTGAKALHHLLPKLLPPIDQAYTGRFFTTTNHPDVERESTFTNILTGFKLIASCLELNAEGYLRSLVGSTDKATSETKLIDNAIIGYVKKHNL